MKGTACRCRDSGCRRRRLASNRGAGSENQERRQRHPPLTLTENPDILASLAKHKQRPKLLIGFAAETEKIVENAQAKLAKKGCDWIVANDVSGDVMGGENNAFQVVTKDGVESWPDSPKDVIARKLMEKVADELAQG